MSGWCLFAVMALAGCGSDEREEPVEAVTRAATAAQGVLTQHNNNARTGATLAETLLNTSNVNPTRFGRLRGLPVRGSVVAQPLFVPNLNVAGVVRSVVYVATMRNLVYAFRADAASTTPLWGPIALGPSIKLPDPEIGNPGYNDTAGEVGIVSTPVVSLSQNALFVVAASKESGVYIHRLHRLDLSTGAAQRAPVVISAPELGFQSQRQNQRPGLLLSNGAVYIAFGAYGDRQNYRGWVFAYNAVTFARQAVQRSTASGLGGGIWMAGSGPAADSAGAVYAITGNGSFSPAPNPLATTELGDSFIKLSGSSLALSSWFSPQNNARLDGEDGDLGASGPILIPGTNIVAGAGKEAKVFLLDRSGMGFFSSTAPPNDDRQPGVLQRFFANPDHCPTGFLASPNCHHVHGSPVFWAGPMGSWLYVWPENDDLKAFRFDTATQRIDCRGALNDDCNAISRSTVTDPEGVAGGSFGMPGGFLSLSANGGAAGSGIVWGLHPYTGNANNAVVEGIVRAFDASNLGVQLWSSKTNADRDDVGPFAKGSVPTIADGRVYVNSLTGMSRKVTLNESSALAPTLSIGAANRLYLGWTGTDARLNVMSSTNGTTFGSKVTLNETSNLGPTLAGDGGQTYLGWIGTNGLVNVIRTTSSTFATSTRIGQTVGGQTFFPSVESSNGSLGLAVGNGRVFVAWTGPDARINVMSAPSGGGNFDGATKVTFQESAIEAPRLTVAGQVYLSWTGTDGRLNVATLGNNGTTIASKVTLDESSNSGPVLVGLTSLAGSSPDLHLAWSGTDGALNLKTADGAIISAFDYKLTFPESSASRPAAAIYGGRIYLGWRGTDAAGQLNVVRYNAGEVNVYTLLN